MALGVEGCGRAGGGEPTHHENGDLSAPRTLPERIVYFYSPGCPECQEVDETILPLLRERGVEVEKVDVETPGGLARIQEAEREYAVRLDVLAPTMVLGDRLLIGLAEIKRFMSAEEP